MSLKWVSVALILGLGSGCHSGQFIPDASGNFETDQTIVSAQGNGLLEQFQVTEGENLRAGQLVGYVDTTQLYDKCLQLQASIREALVQRPDIAAQIDVLDAQLQQAKTDQLRTRGLLMDSAATQKQMDEMNNKVDVIEKQIIATNAQLSTLNKGLLAMVEPLQMEIAQTQDQITNSLITNPVSGTVLTKYAQTGEVALTGKALYSIASLDTLTLRVYVTGDQLPGIRLGQQVMVYIDVPAGKSVTMQGHISWISDEAEFTPKMIPTRDERANLVYAVKIRVKNEGSLKIGMPADVIFRKS